MSAGERLQEAVVAATAGIAGLTGTFDGPPARASFPYLAIDAVGERDWGHKSGAGREVMLATTLWDDVPERLAGLGDAVEQAIAGVATVAGWQLVSVTMVRRRALRDVAGPWAVAIDWRARLLAAQVG